MNAAAQEQKVDAGADVALWVSKNLVDRPRALVVIVHGLCEHAGRYDYVVDRLNACGYSVYRFDNRGHGRSGGDRGFVEDYEQFVDDADRIVALARQDNEKTPVFMLGHSMGGFIAAAYGVKYPDRLAGQILSGAAVILLPAIAPMESVDYNAAAREPIPNSLADVVSRDPAVVQAYKDDPLVLKEFTTKLMGEVLIRGAKRLMEQMGKYRYPCLILHGGGDQIVPADASRYFNEHIASTDKTLKVYDGLYHEILNEPERDTVLADIRAWIDRHS
jgi:acylglycerol lipase